MEGGQTKRSHPSQISAFIVTKRFILTKKAAETCLRDKVTEAVITVTAEAERPPELVPCGRRARAACRSAPTARVASLAPSTDVASARSAKGSQARGGRGPAKGEHRRERRPVRAC
jgi:hypothetical protein